MSARAQQPCSCTNGMAESMTASLTVPMYVQMTVLPPRRARARP